jgi:hypothetical protein
MNNLNKPKWWQAPLTKELIIVLIIKLLAIIVIYQWWFDNPMSQLEQNIEQHLLGNLNTRGENHDSR